jgi:hypothetical protein
MSNEKETVIVDLDSIEALADNIVTISLAMETLTQSRLKMTTIVKLIQMKTGLSICRIRQVISALQDLEKDHLK